VVIAATWNEFQMTVEIERIREGATIVRKCEGRHHRITLDPPEAELEQVEIGQHHEDKGIEKGWSEKHHEPGDWWPPP
jgi:hypothetical protein